MDAPLPIPSYGWEHPGAIPGVLLTGWHSEPCSWLLLGSLSCPTTVLPITPPIPNLLQEEASGKAPNTARGRLNPLDFGEVLHHLKASSQSPAWLDPKRGGQRKPKHNHRGTNPNSSPFLQRLTRSETPRVTLSPRQGQTAFSPRPQQRGASPGLGAPSPAWEGNPGPEGLGELGLCLWAAAHPTEEPAWHHGHIPLLPRLAVSATGEIQHILLIFFHTRCTPQRFLKSY